MASIEKADITTMAKIDLTNTAPDEKDKTSPVQTPKHDGEKQA